MSGETRTLAAFVAGLTFEQIPDDVALRARLLALDLAGSIVRAGVEAESTPALYATIDALGLGGVGAASIIGTPRRLAPPVAALVNAMLGHSLDFDDTHAAASLHPSAPVVSAALAVGEMVGSSGAEIVTAIVAGYEVCCRLGQALDPTSHYARGFHPTATAGTFGAAAAAARLLGLDADGVATAFSLSGCQAAGSFQYRLNGAWTKRWQVGAAAMNGVYAAMLARHGLKGAIDPIEGGHGFLAAYSDAGDPAKTVADLGSVWETRKIGIKLYPCCRYAHAPMDGLIALRAAGLRPDAAISITIGLHRNGIDLVGEPLAEKRRVRDVVGAQFSTPFLASVALHRGAFDWEDFGLIGDPDIEALCDRIEIVHDERLSDAPHPFGATLRVETASGIIERHVRDPSGEGDSFPDAHTIRTKFMSLATPVIGEPEAARLAAIFERFASLPGLDGLLTVEKAIV